MPCAPQPNFFPSEGNLIFHKEGLEKQSKFHRVRYRAQGCAYQPLRGRIKAESRLIRDISRPLSRRWKGMRRALGAMTPGLSGGVSCPCWVPVPGASAGRQCWASVRASVRGVAERLP